jgi:hypothetical protein
MAITSESARLRVLGQELEQRKITDFEIHIDDNGYRVRGTLPPAPAVEAPKPSWSIRGLFKPKIDPCPEPEPDDDVWECIYSTDEIERLDGWYRALRKRAGMPDDYAPSQVLRVIGAYTEDRRWTLASVSRTKELIEIRHRDAAGSEHFVSQKYAELYDFCFHMSRARKPFSAAG